MQQELKLVKISDLVELNAIIDQCVKISDKIASRWVSIKWKSADKDNMELTATITCYQKEEIDRLLGILRGKPTT